MQISFDVHSLGVVLDLAEEKALGTGFALLRPMWIVTAKHVVLIDGIPRTNLGFLSGAVTVSAKPYAIHPEVDLAVIELLTPTPCKVPMYPSYVGFTATDGLLSIGYFPSKSNNASGLRVMEGYPITGHTTEIRERAFGSEEIITFNAPVSEGGNSGSPVFGAGGGVVGVVIENSSPNGSPVARATSLVPLLHGLMYDPQWCGISR